MGAQLHARRGQAFAGGQVIFKTVMQAGDAPARDLAVRQRQAKMRAGVVVTGDDSIDAGEHHGLPVDDAGMHAAFGDHIEHRREGPAAILARRADEGAGVDTPSVIGLGGWSDFDFLFSGGDGIIYAVDQAGQLLFYRDYTQNGTGDVDTPSVIGLGGWTDFKFLFSGGNGIIYAAEKAANPPDVYEIDADLGVAVVLCAQERANVAAATAALNDVNSEIT
jgi:hypothetical protein